MGTQISRFWVLYSQYHAQTTIQLPLNTLLRKIRLKKKELGLAPAQTRLMGSRYSVRRLWRPSPSVSYPKSSDQHHHQSLLFPILQVRHYNIDLQTSDIRWAQIIFAFSGSAFRGDFLFFFLLFIFSYTFNSVFTTRLGFFLGCRSDDDVGETVAFLFDFFYFFYFFLCKVGLERHALLLDLAQECIAGALQKVIFVLCTRSFRV
jgi:hypothetical protein